MHSYSNNKTRSTYWLVFHNPDGSRCFCAITHCCHYQTGYRRLCQCHVAITSGEYMFAVRLVKTSRSWQNCVWERGKFRTAMRWSSQRQRRWAENCLPGCSQAPGRRSSTAVYVDFVVIVDLVHVVETVHGWVARRAPGLYETECCYAGSGDLTGTTCNDLHISRVPVVTIHHPVVSVIAYCNKTQNGSTFWYCLPSCP